MTCAALALLAVAIAPASPADANPPGPSPLVGLVKQPNAADVRTFDDEPLGAPPAGCAARGDIAVAAAELGGAAPGNRAVRLHDDTATQIAELTCAYPASQDKAVAFLFAPAQYRNAFLFGLKGDTAAGGTAHAWWFSLTPVAGTADAVLNVYNGSAWRRLGHVEGAGTPGTFTPVTVSATADAAQVRIGDRSFFTDIRRAATVNLTDVVVSSGGTSLTGMDFYVDDLAVGTELTHPPIDPRTVIAVEPAGWAPRFPDIVRLDDGRLMVTYYSGRGHTDAEGHIRVTESSDNGETWTPPRTVVSGEVGFDQRDPKITQLSDGTILLNYFITHWADPCCNVRTQLGTHVVRSVDGGRTWSDPVWVSTMMSCSQPPPAGGCGGDSGWSASHGSLVELANGDVLAPLYGTTLGDPRQRATVVRSTDGGRTWDLDSEVTIAVSDAFHYQEPNLTVLPSGEIVAGIRTTSSPQVIYVSRSFDDGHTWTTPEPTDIPGSSHHQLLRDDGSLLLTFGDVARGVPGRPTSGVLIPDASGDWSGHRKVPIYDAGNSDQANPSSIELAPGEFLTLGYDVTSGTLYGVHTEVDDYLD
ncbi:sialidase family protein [Jiangella rhizosphaerae]|uniref:sialidase family protein n=1 Tax=Jiangella rhizosphaerae TaxID=2293569 RepID=UPI001313ECF0|nr:sialidase family protein [Jiangella rhizosphaerae]